jgi:hypothetical protein
MRGHAWLSSLCARELAAHRAIVVMHCTTARRVLVYTFLGLTVSLSACGGEPFEGVDPAVAGTGGSCRDAACAEPASAGGGHAAVAGAAGSATNSGGGGTAPSSGGAGGIAAMTGGSGSGGATAGGGAGGNWSGGGDAAGIASTTGGAGAPQMPPAPTGVALSEADWETSASHTYSAKTMAAFAVDDQLDTCWASGTPQVPGMWFLLDLGKPQFFYDVELVTTDASDDYARKLRLSASVDGEHFSELRSHIDGSQVLKIAFEQAQYARYLRLELLAPSGGLWWRIDELDVHR